MVGELMVNGWWIDDQWSNYMVLLMASGELYG